MLGALLLAAVAAHTLMIRMPGDSHRGPLPDLTPRQADTASRLRADVESIAGTIGQRSTYNAASLAQTALWLKGSLESMGYVVIDHSFPRRGAASPNLQVEIPGSAAAARSQIVVVGAHYDAFQGTPGADDNASGVAAILELARRFHDRPASRTIRLVLFVNEEPPAFQTQDMGSLIYVNQARASGDNIRAMFSLESIGYYSDDPGSQKYPPPFGLLYPRTGDFVAFVGNVSSRALVRRSVRTFRESCSFPSEGCAVPGFIAGIGWSDHWAFWQHGIPAVMVTGTAPFRNPNYHEATDTADTLDYERLARVLDGLEVVISDAATEP
jgi:Zn-dependent M28 family amino/carboxypeptidase